MSKPSLPLHVSEFSTWGCPLLLIDGDQRGGGLLPLGDRESGPCPAAALTGERCPALPSPQSPVCAPSPRTVPSAWSGWSQPPATRACFGTRACDLSSWAAWAAVATCTTCCASWPCTPMATRWAGWGSGWGVGRGGRAGLGHLGTSRPLSPTPGWQPAVPHLQGHLWGEDGHSATREDGVSPHPPLAAWLR